MLKLRAGIATEDGGDQRTADGVRLMLVALKADPYNVKATYELAATYSRLGKKQCSINLLNRLLNMRKMRSQKQAVEDRFDFILGRNRYRDRMDRSFHNIRGTTEFREFARKI